MASDTPVAQLSSEWIELKHSTPEAWFRTVWYWEFAWVASFCCPDTGLKQFKLVLPPFYFVNKSTVQFLLPVNFEQMPYYSPLNLTSMYQMIVGVVMVWCGLIGDNTIVGPYFFRGNVNGQSYLDMINLFVVPALSAKYGVQRNGAIPRKWWFQDGAPSHRSRIVTQRLNTLFPNKLVSLNQPIEWPARSPDLTPCDFFLWGYLKNKVFATVPPSLAVRLVLKIMLPECYVWVQFTQSSIERQGCHLPFREWHIWNHPILKDNTLRQILFAHGKKFWGKLFWDAL